MTDQWQRVNEIFHAALERPEDERAAFVASEAGGDDALREEVLSLLQADAAARRRDFLARSAPPPGDATPSAGALIGSYRIERELGRGGMGIVYLAEDIRLGRKVALKALAPSFTTDGQRRERLRKEARAAASLSHANIATVFALEEIEGSLFIASEYVPGRTLREELETAGTSSLDRILQISVQIGRALCAAHAQKIVHRDLKPENVICGEDGAVKILDFGIARSPGIPGQPGARLTDTGTIIGTPGYMSPEQIEAQEIDFRSDLFSFGVVLYELATGVHPFEGRTAASTIGRILALDPCPPSQLRPLPAEFDRIVRTCLQKRAEDRYQSTADLVLDLERLAGVAPLASPAPRAHAAARWWRVHQVAVVGVYAVMTGFAWLGNEALGRDWSLALFFVCIAAAALNGTLRVHLLFTERHNMPAFRTELRRAGPWLTGSDLGFSLALLALAIPLARHQMPIAILLAAVGAGSIIASIAVEPATTEAAFVRRQSGVRRKTAPKTGNPEVKS